MSGSQVIQPPFYDAPIVDYASGQQHSQAWTEYHQSVADRLAVSAANRGVTSGAEATAGQVGEFRTVVVTAGTPVSMSSFTAINVATMTLEAGDWDVWGNVVFSPGGTTTIQAIAAWIGPASATLPGALEGQGYTTIRAAFTTGQHQALSAGRVRLLNTAAQPLYLSAIAGFGVSTMVAYGTLSARRQR